MILTKLFTLVGFILLDIIDAKTENTSMNTTYFDKDDTLVLHFSDKPIAKEISPDWNTHISYAADVSAVEIVIFGSKAQGMLPAAMIKAHKTD